MKMTKWLTCAFLGLGLTMPIADALSTVARAESNDAAVAAAQPLRPSRKERHNRQWRQAKLRAHQIARHGKARDVVKAFKQELNNANIVVNVCVINVLNKAENAAALGGDAKQVINIIDSAKCEIK